MKKNVSTIILTVASLLGLFLLLYPSVSNYWNSLHATQAIAGYARETANLDAEKYEALWSDAHAYNRSLVGRANPYIVSEEQAAAYSSLLNVGGTGIMGYIEIESIGVSLPIYHGTSDAVLQTAVGHLDWSSLPAGGESTHCVFSGHRGLPSAKLFTNLDKLAVGDTFVLRVLDEILTYEVDRILVVEPTETDSLLIEEGEDLCTLVTCTPYAVNSHRLLVRGHQVANSVAAKLIRVTSDAVLIEPILVAPLVAAPLLLVLLILVFTTDSKKKGDKRRREHKNEI